MALGHSHDSFCRSILFRRNKTHPVAPVLTRIMGAEKAIESLAKPGLEVITEWLLNK